MAPRKKQTEEERLRKKREAEKKRQERIKNDPDLLKKEKEKWKAKYKVRKDKGQVKLIKDMTAREIRNQRKNWAVKQRQHREKNKTSKNVQEYLEANSPPESEIGGELECNQEQLCENDKILAKPSLTTSPVTKTDGRLESGKKRKRRNLAKVYRELNKYKIKYETCVRKMEKYRKRCHRMKQKTNNPKSPLTPKTKVVKFLKGRKVDDEVKKKLVFGEVIQTELAKQYSQLKNNKDKETLRNIIFTKVVKKYKMMTLTSRLLKCTPKKSNPNKVNNRKVTMSFNRLHVRRYLEKDENSTLAPGKRDTITRNKIKMQKRYLNNSLYSLHKKFVNTTNLKIGYSSFCRMKPFWIITPNINKRDTCLCLKHSNTNMLVDSLFRNQVITEKSPDQLVKVLTCSEENEKCLLRQCSNCETKTVTYNDYNMEDKIYYHKWINDTEIRPVKGKDKKVKVTKKEKIIMGTAMVINELEKTFPIYMKHIATIKHQYKFINNLKKNLKENEILFHIDFSENFSCKYHEEVQSIHFGASRSQITIHTGVAYTINKKNNEVTPFSFATLSESLRHDPQAIWAHMHPVITKLMIANPNVTKLHFLSDSPTNQYRNKTNFYFFLNAHKRYPTVLAGTYNFSEAGHGKGAPDGVGAVVKRTADRIISEGCDIVNIDTLYEKITEEVKNVFIAKISNDNIEVMDAFLGQAGDLETVDGTMSIHQVVTQFSSGKKDFRTLSCSECSPAQTCNHYPLKIVSRKRKLHPRLRSTEITKKKKGDPSYMSNSRVKPFCSYHEPHQSKRQTSRYTNKVSYYDVYSNSEDDGSTDCCKADEDDDYYTRRSPKPNDYVIVKLAGKKSFKHYVALIVSCDSENEEFTVKYLKRASGNKFVFPDKDDISTISFVDIVKFVEQPVLNKRNQYIFELKLNDMKDLD